MDPTVIVLNSFLCIIILNILTGSMIYRIAHLIVLKGCWIIYADIGPKRLFIYNDVS